MSISVLVKLDYLISRMWITLFLRLNVFTGSLLLLFLSFSFLLIFSLPLMCPCSSQLCCSFSEFLVEEFPGEWNSLLGFLINEAFAAISLITANTRWWLLWRCLVRKYKSLGLIGLPQRVLRGKKSDAGFSHKLSLSSKENLFSDFKLISSSDSNQFSGTF